MLGQRLSKIENQKAAPSFGMVYRICQALSMDVTTLLESRHPFAGDSSRRQVAIRVSHHRNGVDVLLPATPEHRMEAHVVELSPGARSDDPMEHGPGELLGYVFEGKLKLTVDGKTYNVEPGDSFAFSYDRPHSFGNAGARKTRVLFVLAPPVDFASRSRGGNEPGT